MEEFFVKLGLVTQKNHAELLKTIAELKIIVDTLDFRLQRQCDEINSRFELNERALRQVDEQIALTNELRRNEMSEVKSSVVALTKKISAASETSSTNHAELKSSVVALTKKISALSDEYQRNADELSAVGELLRLTAANQIMNLVEK